MNDISFTSRWNQGLARFIGEHDGAWWRILTPKQQERVLRATVEEALKDEPKTEAEQLSWAEVQS